MSTSTQSNVLPTDMEEDLNVYNYFYENKVPKVDELVMVRVNSIDDVGVLCSLLEYGGLEGFLPLSEISRKRMRSVMRHVKVNQKQVLQVLRVDTERGYVDLSKKYIQAAEKEEGDDKYQKGKHVYSITARLADVAHVPIKTTFDILTFPLYQSTTYSHPQLAMKAIAAGNATLEELIPAHELLTEDLVKKFNEICRLRMAVQPVKIGALMEVTSYSEGGVDDIKASLKAGLATLTEKETAEVHLQLISSPSFMVWTTTIDEIQGTATLQKVIDQVEARIGELGGNFKLSRPPSAIGKEEDFN
eukprot:TRINITY_DN2989_c0_g1_i1.p1 TRINITY_DN2989_c0_g1~~TRINITY_DN2989_c0_g1_i1.p1  ORF type:complete len:322 (-),score=112.54 TRINITY_DN2989_c0_g1_i1:144-1052(-)